MKIRPFQSKVAILTQPSPRANFITSRWAVLGSGRAGAHVVGGVFPLNARLLPQPAQRLQLPACSCRCEGLDRQQGRAGLPPRAWTLYRPSRSPASAAARHRLSSHSSPSSGAASSSGCGAAQAAARRGRQRQPGRQRQQRRAPACRSVASSSHGGHGRRLGLADVVPRAGSPKLGTRRHPSGPPRSSNWPRKRTKTGQGH